MKSEPRALPDPAADPAPVRREPDGGGLTADISRELRAPLTVLLGYLEWLQPQAREDQAMVVKRMIAQARHMQTMLDNLLELSRLINGPEVAGREVVDVPAILTQLREKAEEQSAGDHFLNFQIEEGLRLEGDPLAIESAARHLLANALTFTPPGGAIEMKWSRQPDALVLSVRDGGVGIPQEDIPRLTERFYRVAGSEIQNTGGTGLGLSIVKQALDRHQAHLRIQSVLGKGSWFCCEFPLARAAGSPEASEVEKTS